MGRAGAPPGAPVARRRRGGGALRANAREAGRAGRSRSGCRAATSTGGRCWRAAGSTWWSSSRPTRCTTPSRWRRSTPGAHVICEKPLALDAGAGPGRWPPRPRPAGRQTLTFFTHRALAAAAHVKRLVEEGFLGRPLHVERRYFSASHLQAGQAGRLADAPRRGRHRRPGRHRLAPRRPGALVARRRRPGWPASGRPSSRERAGGAVDADEDCAFLAAAGLRRAGRLPGQQAGGRARQLPAGRAPRRPGQPGLRGRRRASTPPGRAGSWPAASSAPASSRWRCPPTSPPGSTRPDDRAGRDGRLPPPHRPVLRGDPRRPAAGHPDFRDGAAVQAVLDAVAASAERGAWVDVE